MKKTTLSLTKKERDALDEIWKLTKNRMNDETFNLLGWEDKEKFFSDLFRYGVDKASDDPPVFIKFCIDQELPIFKEGEPEEYKRDFKKMYG